MVTRRPIELTLIHTPAKDGKEKEGGKSLGARLKSAAKKINANVQSRMNFRKLNIRSKGAGKGRFGKRR